jgi:hypothetical protein
MLGRTAKSAETRFIHVKRLRVRHLQGQNSGALDHNALQG